MNEAYTLPVGFRKWYLRRFFEQKESEKDSPAKQKIENPLTKIIKKK